MNTYYQLVLPKLPNDLENELTNQAASIQISEQKRKWLEDFHDNEFIVGGQEYGTVNTTINPTLKKRLDESYKQFFSDEDIDYTLGKMTAHNLKISTIPPHCDRGRQLACNYLLDTGGTNVQTVFYNYTRDDDELASSLNIRKFNLVSESGIVMKPKTWYIFNAQQAHGVENLSGSRLILSISFGTNIRLKDFVEKYSTMVTVA